MSQFRHPPYAHQVKALEVSKSAVPFAFFCEMGTGKTKIAIDDTARLYREGKIDALFVVANKGSYMNWPSKEIPEHLPFDVPYTCWIWDGAEKVYLPSAIKPRLEVLVMNVEALAFPRSYKVAETFLKRTKAIMIVDESTSIKTPTAKRTKAATALGLLARYRRILTGSPITKNPLDLYAQCNFLQRGILGFTSYYAFRARYADLFEMSNGQRSFKMIKGYKNLDELSAKLATFSFRVLKEECLDLPPKIYQRVDVELTPEQTRLYKQLKEEALAEFAGGVTFAPLAITRLLRLHQVICGHLPTEEGVLVAIPNNRLKALEKVLDECSGKVVIWATYTADIEAICLMLHDAYPGAGFVRYDGSTSAQDRAAAVQGFQDPNGPRFFVGNPKAGGYGITLHAASTMIYYSNNYDLETRLQSEDRIHRIGQTKSCNYIDLVAKGTVDEKIISALVGKKQMAGEVLGDKWREWL